MFVLDAIRTFAQTDRIALINRQKRLSFAELDARSDAFAGWLLARCGSDRSPVVICGHKETNFLPCVYGCLKSGRAYVPIDPVIPPERAAEIVADVQPQVIVNFSGHELRSDAAVLHADTLETILLSAPQADVTEKDWVCGNDTAYILFTSGSTGRPKGVPITVNNLTGFYEGLLPFMKETGGVILNQISYSFDVSCCSIYAGLSRGMTLFTVDKEMVEDVGSLFEQLRQSELTMWVSTPSFAELCAGSKAFSADLMPKLQSFLFCGEVLTHKLCDTLAQRFPAARLLNTYGPTEATVLVTAVSITEAMRREEPPIPIGAPLDNVELRIVDGQGQVLLQDEEYGELLIIGDCISPGYHRRPDLTAKAFFTDEKTGMWGYRTGDICCRRNGLFYFAGRADNQIKLNGYRVELEDIENNLMQLENVARAAVVPVWADGEKSRVQYLAAFLLMEHDDGLSALKRTIALKRQASDYLPSYMIPRKMIAVDSYP